MPVFLISVHVIVCIALILIVLLQTGKGADMGAAFGGGASNTLFGSTGATTFLGKATTAAAIIFMITSLTLAYTSSRKMGGSVMNNVKTPGVQQTVPAEDDTKKPVGQTETTDKKPTPPATGETNKPE